MTVARRFKESVWLLAMGRGAHDNRTAVTRLEGPRRCKRWRWKGIVLPSVEWLRLDIAATNACLTTIELSGYRQLSIHTGTVIISGSTTR